MESYYEYMHGIDAKYAKVQSYAGHERDVKEADKGLKGFGFNFMGHYMTTEVGGQQLDASGERRSDDRLIGLESGEDF